MADGTKYTAKKPGGTVEIDDRHVDAVRKSQHKDIGLLSHNMTHRLRTKTGRSCPGCGFSAQSWSYTCPRCSTDTVLDQF